MGIAQRQECRPQNTDKAGTPSQPAHALVVQIEEAHIMKLVAAPPGPRRYRFASQHVFDEDGACVLEGLVEYLGLKRVRRWRVDR
eukprot:2953923-Alexandrium_andersonii.AAC.1